MNFSGNVDRGGANEDGDRPFAGIGRVVVTAGVIEANLRVLNALLVGSENAGVLVAGQGTDTLVKGAVALAEAHSGVTAEQLAGLRTLMAECERLFKERNHLVHGLWHTSEATAVVLRSRYRKLTLEPMTMPTEDQLAELDGEFEMLSMMIFLWILSFKGLKLTDDGESIVAPGGLSTEEIDALLTMPNKVLASVAKVPGRALHDHLPAAGSSSAGTRIEPPPQQL